VPDSGRRFHTWKDNTLIILRSRCANAAGYRKNSPDQMAVQAKKLNDQEIAPSPLLSASRLAGKWPRRNQRSDLMPIDEPHQSAAHLPEHVAAPISADEAGQA